MATWGAYGDAVITRQEDGCLVVERADPVIGVSLQLLAEAGESLPVDESGCILLAGDPRYRYRPLRFAGTAIDHSGPVGVLVCERVPVNWPPAALEVEANTEATKPAISPSTASTGAANGIPAKTHGEREG